MENKRPRESRAYRTLVQCYYCDKTLQLDNLEDHVHTQHGEDFPVRRKGEVPLMEFLKSKSLISLNT